MRSLKPFHVLACILWLAGCTGYELDALRETTPRGPAFTKALTKEYLAFATFEGWEMYDWPDALHFARKGLKTAAGSPEPPEELSRWNLPKDKIEALSRSRARLLAALDGGARERRPELAARAQAKFDCWVEQQEENWQWDHIRACREGLEAALKRLEAAPGKGYTLYFDFDSARIRPAGTRTIDTVIGTLDGLAGPAVTLGGHADRAGTEAYNLDLSLRRARSVHDALVRRGIPPSRVTIQAFGEMRPKVPTQDGVREPGNRRVEILLNAR